jgi:hypothetical protein
VSKRKEKVSNIIVMCQKEKKVVKKLSKSCQKVVKKLSKKLSKNCHKVVKKLKKLTKGSARYHRSFYESREAMSKEKKKDFWCHRRVKVPKCVTSISILRGQYGYLLHF